MCSSYPGSLKGQLLVAMPGLLDPNFYQTVTCMSEHTAEGAVGLVINRIHPGLTGKMIFEELKLEFRSDADRIPIHIGGPVHLGEIFVLHGSPFGWKGCLRISDTLAMSNSIDILEAVALGEGPKSFLITLGCAGWGGGQLEEELRQNAWLNCPADREIIFQLTVENRWEASVKRLGIDPALLSNTPGHA